MVPLFYVLTKQGKLFSNFKTLLLKTYDPQNFVPLSNLVLVSNREIYTTRQNLIFPSFHRRKKHEFENPYASMLQVQKKRQTSPQILLLDASEKIEVMTLDMANKLALTKDLKLVRIEDPEKYIKGNKPVYQLMTGKEYHDEVMKKKSKNNTNVTTGFKGEKAIMLTSNIGAHDLETKMKHMVGWVQKNFQIKVTITGSESSADDQFDDVISKIEEGMQECGGRVLQKIIKSGHLKCFINPPKPSTKTKPHVPESETPLPGTS